MKTEYGYLCGWIEKSIFFTYVKISMKKVNSWDPAETAEEGDEGEIIENRVFTWRVCIFRAVKDMWISNLL